MTALRALVAALALAAWTLPAAAQDYRIRLDARAQAISYRGLAPDSIDAALAVPTASGGLVTPDGFALRCNNGPYCYYLRPGPELRALPVAVSASMVLWGLGVEGLAVRATGRLVTDAGGDAPWPGTTPNAQLLEGYVEYQRSPVTLRVGRQLVASRLEPIGFDGGWLKVRWDDAALELTGYGGWGLGQAAAVTASNPALNPLDEWRPRDRQILGGAEATWRFRWIDARAEYRREIDPADGNFVSERAALSLGAQVGPFRASGGTQYNMAEGKMGTTDLALTYLQPRYSVTVGARRYVPFFSLWTLWGAFSPVPYNSVSASAQVRPNGWLSLNARGESYRYDDAEINTSIVPRLEAGGWRMSTGATATVGTAWTLEGSFGLERGPGAAGRFTDASVTWAPSAVFSVDLYAGSLARPLELRYYDATSRWIGGRGEWQFSPQHRVWCDAALVSDDRYRPDASASSLSQLRLRAGFSVAVGSGADRTPLPRARPLPR